MVDILSDLSLLDTETCEVGFTLINVQVHKEQMQ